MALRQVFRRDWDSLTRRDVQAYLDETVDEPLLVEAKGTHVDCHQVVRTVCGFANIEQGGYLILGAVAGQLTGWTFPEREPRVWLSNIIEARLDPVPSFDIHVWPKTGSMNVPKVAVIRVWPAAVTPCITSLGEVFERLPGKTQPVREGATLRRLIERGNAARNFAWQESHNQRDHLRQHTVCGREARPISLSVSLGCTSFERDLAARIFRKPVEDWALAVLRRPDLMTFIGSPAMTMSTATEVNQHGFRAYSFDLSRIDWDGYFVQLTRAGAVGAATTLTQGDPRSIAHDAVRRLWLIVNEGARLLAGRGAAHVAIRLYSEHDGAVEIDRWWMVEDEPSTDLLDGIEREIRWSRGEPAFLPD